MKYCTKCVMPDTKPFITFNSEGVCSACVAHDKKNSRRDSIDWDKREKMFSEIVNDAKKKKSPFFDVVVPVSGGKDSIFQVHKALEYGLRVLAVNVDYGIKTEIGHKNLQLVPEMGATLITLTPEYKIHKELIRKGFEDYGDPDLMSHGLLYAFPHWIAVKYNVPLILWGENSAFEYGGDEVSAKKFQIDKDWFLKHVMTQGVTIEEINKKYKIPIEALRIYDFPEKELKKQGIVSVFLSSFFKWDSEKHLKLALTYGFQHLSEHREGTFRKYVGIDEKINRIHQYMKVLKFGYGRCTDHACEEIRNNRMTRDEAIKLIKKYDTQELSDFYVDDYCKFLGYSKKKFYEILEKSRNKEIWFKDDKWKLKDWIAN